MDWLEFILNNDAAIGAIIGMSVMGAIIVFMIYYATSHLINDKGEE